jgi:transcriptional regulator with XRE-family HTH domain
MVERKLQSATRLVPASERRLLNDGASLTEGARGCGAAGDRRLVERLTAGLSQAELAERVRLPRQQIVRWEGDVVEPGLSTLRRLLRRRLLRACGFDLPLSLVPYKPDPEREAQLERIQRQTPQERLAGLLERLGGLMAERRFDPYAILAALERERVTYVLIGGLAV